MTAESIAAEEPSVEHAKDILHTALSLFLISACACLPFEVRATKTEKL